MQELDRRIASLKLRLAEIEQRERSLDGLRRQYEQQLANSVEYAIWGESHLDAALNVANDVDGRLRALDVTLKQLGAIKVRAQDELHTLRLTRNVEDAKAQLAALDRRQQALAAEIERLAGGGEGAGEGGARLDAQRQEVTAEMRRLRRVIDEASDEAGRHISARRRLESP